MTEPIVHRRSSRRAQVPLSWLALAVLAATACAGDPPDEGEAAQAIITAPTLPSVVDGVGATPEGEVAVHFKGAWFSLHASATAPWELSNAVSATAIGAVPIDTSESSPDCECVGSQNRGCTRQEQIQQCGTTISTTTNETRTYALTVGPSQYEVKALQTRHTERAIAAPFNLRLGFAADLKFEVRVVTPGVPGIGDARWVIGAKPKRSFISCQFDDATLEQINVAAQTTTSQSPADCDAAYSTDVQFAYARTESLPGATEMVAPSNDATDQALRQVLPSDTTYVADVEPEAWDVRGDVHARTADSTFGDRADLDRVSRFFLKANEIGEYTDPATERPLLGSLVPRLDQLGLFPANGQSWSFSHTIIDQHAHFPILAGICGIDAFVKSSISGSTSYGAKSCFDGWVQSLTFNGRLAFDASAGAGGYCNIIVASASAGLSAGVSTAVEFSSRIDTLPPAIVTSLNEYAELKFSAYFQTRILFWSKRWEKPFVARRVWQRGTDLRVTEQVSAPQLCTSGIDLRDMLLLDTPRYLVPGKPLPFPPPIPDGVTVQLELVVPGYANPTAGLVLETDGGAQVIPVFTALGSHPLGSLFRAELPSDLIGTSGSQQRVRFARPDSIGGVAVRHLSNWIVIPRVGP